MLLDRRSDETTEPRTLSLRARSKPMTTLGWFIFGGGAIGALIGIAVQLYKGLGYAEGKLVMVLRAFAGTN